MKINLSLVDKLWKCFVSCILPLCCLSLSTSAQVCYVLNAQWGALCLGDESSKAPVAESEASVVWTAGFNVFQPGILHRGCVCIHRICGFHVSLSVTMWEAMHCILVAWHSVLRAGASSSVGFWSTHPTSGVCPKLVQPVSVCVGVACFGQACKAVKHRVPLS